MPDIKEAIAKGELFRAHAFDYACAKLEIEHRMTKVKHPWTNGHVERMNRTIKGARVKRFRYESHIQVCTHIADFMGPSNCPPRPKTPRSLTPYE